MRGIVGGLVLLLVAVPVARAGEASVQTRVEGDGSGKTFAATVKVVGAPGERNTLTLRGTTLTDTTAPLTARVGCRQLTPNSVDCPRAAADSFRLRVDGGDGDDRLTLDLTRFRDFAEVRGGRGNDRVNITQEVRSGYLSGQSGNDRIVSSDRRGAGMTIYGDAGSDTLVGGTGRDAIRGGPGADVMAGKAGRDILIGAAGDDTLDGGLGNDELFGGRGRDLFRAGAGRDTLFSRDGVRDFVGCGRGRDRVLKADRRDLLTGCERVGR